MRLKIKGHVFTFTGFFVIEKSKERRHISRDTLRELLKNKSSVFSDNVSKKVDFLVEGYSNKKTKMKIRSKLVRVDHFDIQIISCFQFTELLTSWELNWLWLNSEKETHLSRIREPQDRIIIKHEKRMLKNAA